MSPIEIRPSKSMSSKQRGEVRISGSSNVMKTNNAANKPANQRDSDTTLARVTGIFFVLIGILLVGLVVFSFVVSRLPYRVDNKMPVPTLSKLPTTTTDSTISVQGETIPGETVALYENGKLSNATVTANNDGKFTFKDTKFTTDQTNNFEAVTVSGKVFKRRSEKSNTVTVKLASSTPTTPVKLEFSKSTTSGTTTIKGTAEKNVRIKLNVGQREYETQADRNGNFTFKDVKLDPGSNQITVTPEDGQNPQKITISYNKPSINGNGATTNRNTGTSGQLPESAGELDAALDFIRGNKLMTIMGLIALLGFAGSSSAVFLYNSKRKK